MPFAGNYNDPYFKDHQDWFAKGPDGKPYETAWGGTCLDMTQAGRPRELAKHRAAHRPRMGLQGFQDGRLLDRHRHAADLRQRRLQGRRASAKPASANPDKTQHRGPPRRRQAGARGGRAGRFPAGLLRLAEHAILRRVVRTAGRDARGARHGGRPHRLRRMPRDCGSSTAASGGTIRIASPCARPRRWSRPGSTPRSPPSPATCSTTATGCPTSPPSGWTSCGAASRPTACASRPVDVFESQPWPASGTWPTRGGRSAATWSPCTTGAASPARPCRRPRSGSACRRAEEYVGLRFLGRPVRSAVQGAGRGRAAAATRAGSWPSGRCRTIRSC